MLAGQKGYGAKIAKLEMAFKEFSSTKQASDIRHIKTKMKNVQ